MSFPACVLHHSRLGTPLQPLLPPQRIHPAAWISPLSTLPHPSPPHRPRTTTNLRIWPTCLHLRLPAQWDWMYVNALHFYNNNLKGFEHTFDKLLRNFETRVGILQVRAVQAGAEPGWMPLSSNEDGMLCVPGPFTWGGGAVLCGGFSRSILSHLMHQPATRGSDLTMIACLVLVGAPSRSG